jgi:hypothetical protein
MTRPTMYWGRAFIAAAAVFAVTGTVSPFGTTVAAQDPYVYPSKGQSKDQTEKDKYSCYQWAKGQTGFDPMQQPTASAPPPQKKGGAVRGAAGGAAVGAVGGAIGGDAGKGAAIGAVAGGVIGAARRNRSNKEQEQYAQQQGAEYNQKRSEYNRAWGACLEGKGYTVK